MAREKLREDEGEYVGEGWQNAPSQNMPLQHEDYFELIILRNSRHRRSSENRGEVSLTLGKFTFTKKISMYVSLSVPGREGDCTSLETLIHGEGLELNLCNNLIFADGALPDRLP